jgi:hypothetical protein
MLPTAANGTNLLLDSDFDLPPTAWGTSPDWEPYYVTATDPRWAYNTDMPFSPPYSQGWSGEPEWYSGGIYQAVEVPQTGKYAAQLLFADHGRQIPGLGPPGPTGLRFGVQWSAEPPIAPPGPPIQVSGVPATDVIWWPPTGYWPVDARGVAGWVGGFSLPAGWARFWVQTVNLYGPGHTRVYVDVAELYQITDPWVVVPVPGFEPWELLDSNAQSGAEFHLATMRTPTITYETTTGNLKLDTGDKALSGFIIFSPRETFNGTAILPEGFWWFYDNEPNMISSQWPDPQAGGTPLAGIHDFGDHVANAALLWNAEEGRWDLDDWEFTYTIADANGIHTGLIEILSFLPGDTDRDGDVDAWDIQLILAANSYDNGPGWSWEQGDFDLDGCVTWADIEMILDHGQYGQGMQEALLAMPEPATVALLAAACGLALRGRRGRAVPS